MNHRITLLQRDAGGAGSGQPSKHFAEVATIWADVRFQTGAEVLRAGAEVAVKRISARIRARAGLDTGWRVRYQGEVFDVKSALPDADRSFIFLVCEVVR